MLPYVCVFSSVSWWRFQKGHRLPASSSAIRSSKWSCLVKRSSTGQHHGFSENNLWLLGCGLSQPPPETRQCMIEGMRRYHLLFDVCEDVCGHKQLRKVTRQWIFNPLTWIFWNTFESGKLNYYPQKTHSWNGENQTQVKNWRSSFMVGWFQPLHIQGCYLYDTTIHGRNCSPVNW